ncbi:MAG: hypothetical protein JXA79_11840, partial [Deltaproteobacteria bacterium]|nr:hypothetical protein [Deltaproteobacteria bacterium]
DKIEIAFLDSEHSYENKLFEYRTIWPHLRGMGYLVTRSADRTTAWSEFCQDVGIKDTKLRLGHAGIKK